MELIDRIADFITGYEGLYDGQFKFDVPTETLKGCYLRNLSKELESPQCMVLDQKSAILISHLVQWDSDFFGYPVHKLDHLYFKDNKGAHSLLSDYINQLASAGAKYVFTRVPSEDFAVQNVLTAHGFELMIHKVMLRVSIGNLKHATLTISPNGVKVRSFGEGDAAFVTRLAKQSLRMNRFTSDKGMDPEKAAGVYESWIKNVIHHAPEDILVAEHEGIAYGMIAISDMHSLYTSLTFQEKTMGFINLIAVDENMRGKSIGKALMYAAIEQFMQKDYKVIYANTALQNMGSITMFQQCGFRLFSMVSEYRCWL